MVAALWNHNNWTLDILSWHGHDRSGVHVPFQEHRNPLETTVETDLVKRMRLLGERIAAGEPGLPRWVFLVGGPGNGKSETVQDFLVHLDEQLGLGGELIRLLSARFKPEPLVPRGVEITANDMAAYPQFQDKVGYMLIIQDATATEDAFGNAAEQLANELDEHLRDHPPDGDACLVIVCANRGLLTRALREADKAGQEVVKDLLARLINASGQGTESLKNRVACWPLDDEPRQVACWPLDIESLLNGDNSPFEQVLVKAVDEDRWETLGCCADCAASTLCPFRQNAVWLRENKQQLREILRHGELATGQRWNFRDLYSLVAEIMIGQWSDFQGHIHPCDWVHNLVRTGTSMSMYLLIQRLYPHALFPGGRLGEIADRVTKPGLGQPKSASIIEALSNDVPGSAKPIREMLRNDYGPLDPAQMTPSQVDDTLYQLESQYSQSIALGNQAATATGLAGAEMSFLQSLEDVERNEWDFTGREAYRANPVIRLFRQVACLIAKRSVGVRTGRHANETYLKEYEDAMVDRYRLNRVKEILHNLLGERGFTFNVTGGFGQPHAGEETLVTLYGDRPGIEALPAEPATESYPARAIPCFKLAGESYLVPVTFDFFLALRLRQEHCSSSSLPASVRASIDRVKHLYAGLLCRDAGLFVNGTVSIKVETATVKLYDENSEPELE